MSSSPLPPSVLPIVCPGHIRPVVGLRYCQASPSPSLNLLVTSSHDKTAQVRWGADGAWIGSFVGHSGAVWSTALDRDGLRAVTGSADFSAKLWDASSGQLLRTFAHQHVVKAVDFAPCASRILTAGFEKLAKVFDVNEGGGGGGEEAVIQLAHPCAVTKALWINHHELVTGAQDGVVRRWDVRCAPDSPSQQCALSLAASASASSSSTSGVGAGKGVTDLELDTDGGGLVACCGRTASLFEASQFAAPVQQVHVKFDLESASRSKHKHDKLLCGGMDIHVVNLLDSPNVEECAAVFRGHHGPVFTCRFDPTNPDSFASGSGDGTIRIWKLSSAGL